MRVPRPLTTALAVAALALGGAISTGTTASAQPDAPTPAPSSRYDRQMLQVMADTFGITVAQAAGRLDREHAQSAALAALTRRGVETGGAFFSGDDLVVYVASAAATRAARDAGLTPRTAKRDQADLDALSARVPAIAGDDVAQVQTYGPDLPSQSVVVTVAPGADAHLLQRLSGPGPHVRTGEAGGLAPTADVVGGRIMDLVPGTHCSLGYPGTTSDGNNVLLTAGHCVEGLPDVLDANGTHIGKGIATRFRSGKPSVDMGLMDIDPEDVGRAYIDTRMGTTVVITGMSKAPVGTAICKAGNTTGWTCGSITNYNLTVNYGSSRGRFTSTSGLARSTVCTEGGDSGGAYISGNTAQGMTSGGPSDGHDCGYNQGTAATGSYSFYQPVVDAASYYGVTLTTS